MTFQGFTVQFFQRGVMQLGANGVQTLNLLEDGLLPYTTINGSTFPASDPALIKAAPTPSDPALRLEDHRLRQGERAGHLGGHAGQLRQDVLHDRQLRGRLPARRGAGQLAAAVQPRRSGARRPPSRCAIRRTTTSCTCASSAASCTTTTAASAPRASCWATT